MMVAMTRKMSKGTSRMLLMNTLRQYKADNNSETSRKSRSKISSSRGCASSSSSSERVTAVSQHRPTTTTTTTPPTTCNLFSNIQNHNYYCLTVTIIPTERLVKLAADASNLYRLLNPRPRSRQLSRLLSGKPCKY